MIDLRSDTVTKPSPAMREAMASAEVGDDVYGEDPTVNRLQEMAAALVGKPAALFVPTGIMANQLSIRVQTRPGDEVIVESRAHIVRYEHGAAAALAGVQLHWVAGRRGILEPEQVQAAIRPKDPYNPVTGLICLENTHNSGGGSIYPLPAIERIRAIALTHGIPMHLDGARLFNAVVATGIPAKDYAKHFETVSFCLSKGLGAPVGSLIAADEATVAKLRPLRRMYGGGMRQAGILAAAGIYALEHNIARLKEDHEHARRLVEALARIPTVSVDPACVDTNIVVFEVRSARSTADILASLKREGVLVNSVGDKQFRAVTHLDVSAKDIEEAGRVLARVLAS
ncbi:MAG: GntG family PLP-dependent aldolase [Nitrospirota bacterium]